ncbi:DUF6460 domain-containing protein [uncultured Methylovirgula sp.]|uniref:DUF6460 domain-containing protein n=1 Tax=uncultured Methylovirgula sp. TaxID=1285960 RepID=UPI0026172A88|nr:DUF6460 domain-containing protein [uncultured Methylovirgula sp.]
MVEDINPAPPPAPSAWAPAQGAPSRKPRPDTPLTRFLGGSPVGVFFRLFFLSLVVGALLMWLDIRPYDVIDAVVRFAHRIWALGFDAIRELGDYLLAGAIIVVPIWFVSRLLSARR